MTGAGEGSHERAVKAGTFAVAAGAIGVVGISTALLLFAAGPADSLATLAFCLGAAGYIGALCAGLVAITDGKDGRRQLRCRVVGLALGLLVPAGAIVASIVAVAVGGT